MSELVEAAMKFRDALHQGWCQNHHALTEDGVSVGSRHSHAQKFCLEGAAIRAGADLNDLSEDLVRTLSRYLFGLLGVEARARGFESYLAYNDDSSRTYAEILDFADAVVRRAKELAEAS